MHVTVLLRQDKGCLPFKVEMLLPADVDLALDHMGGPVDGGCSIAPRPDARAFFEPAVSGQRLFDRQQGLCGLGFDPGQRRGLAGGQMAGGGHQKQRLAVVMDRAVRQQGFIMVRRRTIAGRRQVRGGPDPNHTGCRAHRIKVQGGQPSGGDGRCAKGQMQAIGGGGDIVDIARLAGHMQAGGVMGQGFGHAHGRTSNTLVACP